MVRPAHAPGPALNQPALVALPLDTLQLCANESATLSGTKQNRHEVETPSGEDMVQRARVCAATAITGFTNASVSADLLAHAKSLNDVSLATREFFF